MEDKTIQPDQRVEIPDGTMGTILNYVERKKSYIVQLDFGVMEDFEGRIIAWNHGAELMDGTTADVIAQRGVLKENVTFIGKSFNRDGLARKMRKVLGA